jgi:hypothetical protein
MKRNGQWDINVYLRVSWGEVSLSLSFFFTGSKKQSTKKHVILAFSEVWIVLKWVAPRKPKLTSPHLTLNTHPKTLFNFIV